MQLYAKNRLVLCIILWFVKQPSIKLSQFVTGEPSNTRLRYILSGASISVTCHVGGCLLPMV